MNFRNIFNLVAFFGAMGLAAMMAASSASAQIVRPIFYEDDNLDFLIEANGETDGILSEGDILVAILELNDANGVPIGPEELTGISVIEVIGFADLDGIGGANDIIFGPATDGFNAITGLDVEDGSAGQGAMVAFFLDPADDLQIDAGSVLAGNESCQDLNTCIAQASNGDAWLTVGFSAADLDADDFWVALNAEGDTNIVFEGNLTQEFASVNAGLSILDNQTGLKLIEDSIPCGVFCGVDNGNVDWLAGGSVKGGGNGGQNHGEWIATSDFDMTLLYFAPTPGTVALFTIGLAGLGWSRRRTRN